MVAFYSSEAHEKCLITCFLCLVSFNSHNYLVQGRAGDGQLEGRVVIADYIVFIRKEVERH